MAPVPGGYSQGHEEYEGRQRRANEANDPRVLVLSARTICTRRNIDGGRRAKHAYGSDLKVGVVVVARRANHIIVVADTRARLGEYLRIASYVLCNNQNCQFGVLVVQGWPATCCDSPKSGSSEKNNSRVLSRDTISCFR
jgi:hypothetical protein